MSAAIASRSGRTATRRTGPSVCDTPRTLRERERTASSGETIDTVHGAKRSPVRLVAYVQHVDVKKVLLLVAAAVLIYTLIVHPTQLADGVQTVFGWITDGIESVITFFKRTFS
jgi:hypothetical protein